MLQQCSRGVRPSEGRRSSSVYPLGNQGEDQRCPRSPSDPFLPESTPDSNHLFPSLSRLRVLDRHGSNQSPTRRFLRPSVYPLELSPDVNPFRELLCRPPKSQCGGSLALRASPNTDPRKGDLCLRYVLPGSAAFRCTKCRVAGGE